MGRPLALWGLQRMEGAYFAGKEASGTNPDRRISLRSLAPCPRKCLMRDYEEKSVNKIFYDNDRRKTGMKSAFRLCFIYNSYKIACQERTGNPPVFLTFFIIRVSVPHT